MVTPTTPTTRYRCACGARFDASDTDRVCPGCLQERNSTEKECGERWVRVAGRILPQSVWETEILIESATRAAYLRTIVMAFGFPCLLWPGIPALVVLIVLFFLLRPWSRLAASAFNREPSAAIRLIVVDSLTSLAFAVSLWQIQRGTQGNLYNWLPCSDNPIRSILENPFLWVLAFGPLVLQEMLIISTLLRPGLRRAFHPCYQGVPLAQGRVKASPEPTSLVQRTARWTDLIGKAHNLICALYLGPQVVAFVLFASMFLLIGVFGGRWGC